MQIKRLIQIALLIIIFIGGSLFIWQLFGSQTSAELISKSDVENIIKDRYPGEILEIIEDPEYHTIRIQPQTGIYQIIIDRKTGKVINIVQTHVADQNEGNNEQPIDERPIDKQPVDKQPTDKQPTDKQPNNEPPKKEEKAATITQEKAVAIALEKVQGEVDDVEFEVDDDGTKYFEVEIERSDGMEATVQIHAITGEVMLILWDD